MKYLVPLQKSRTIKNPGSRGGRFWLDRRGAVHYGSKPKPGLSPVVSGDYFDHSQHLPRLLQHASDHTGIKDLSYAARMHPERLAHILAHLDSKHPGAVEVRTHPSGKVKTVRINRSSVSGVPDSVEEYVRPFLQKVQSFPTTFLDFVPGDVRETGDRLLVEESSIGDHAQRYEVFPRATVSSALADRKRAHVTYSMYVDYVENGKTLLAELHKRGLAVPYKVYPLGVVERSTDAEHGKLARITNGRKVLTVSRTMQYMIDFLAGDPKQARRIVDFINLRAAARGQSGKEVIEGSWDIPDMRTSTKFRSGDQVRGWLNYIGKGKQEVAVVGTFKLDDKGYTALPIFVDSGTRGIAE